MEFAHSFECQESLTKDLPELENMESISVFEGLDELEVHLYVLKKLREKYPERDREEVNEMVTYITDRIDYWNMMEDEDDRDEREDMIDDSWGDIYELINHFIKYKSKYNW